MGILSRLFGRGDWCARYGRSMTLVCGVMSTSDSSRARKVATCAGRVAGLPATIATIAASYASVVRISGLSGHTSFSYDSAKQRGVARRAA